MIDIARVAEMITHIGRAATLIPIDQAKGRVVGVWIDDGLLLKYSVRYFHNGETKTGTFYDDEVTVLPRIRSPEATH